MRIDVWSDLVCPWCYIGFVRLEKAIALANLDDVTVVHHAYQLDRLAAEEPRRAVEFLALAYGIEIEDAMAMNEDVSDVAADEGLNYRLDVNLVANTALAHRVLAFAFDAGVGGELLMRLFKAGFEEAQPIFSLEDLQPYCIEVGLDWPKVVAAMEAGEYLDVLKADRELAEQVGVRGTPYFVFNQQVSVNGADTVETLVEKINAVLHL
jgi:predicted DsbA family dithiol-disulfide isomerase